MHLANFGVRPRDVVVRNQAWMKDDIYRLLGFFNK